MLQGKVFISTVSIHKSDEIKNIFALMGATVIDFPMIEIIPAEINNDIQNVINHISKFDWIIFTSANGVKHFYNLIEKFDKKSDINSNVKLAAIGMATAKELEKTDKTPDFISSGNSSEYLVNELIEKENLQQKNILLPLGNLAPDVLQDRLKKITNVTRINIYNTIKPRITYNEPLERIENNNYDLVLFTSPSGVENFADMLGSGSKLQSIRAASIGAVTTVAINKLGINCVLTATTSTYEGLANEIEKHYTQKTN